MTVPSAHEHTVELDGRNRISLNGLDLRSKTYFVRADPEGTIVLEPAVVMSMAEAAYLRHPEVQAVVEEGLNNPQEHRPRTKRRERTARSGEV